MSKHSNQRFQKYVDKYCQKHGIVRKEALSHELVKLVKEKYEQEGCDYAGSSKTNQR